MHQTEAVTGVQWEMPASQTVKSSQWLSQRGYWKWHSERRKLPSTQRTVYSWSRDFEDKKEVRHMMNLWRWVKRVPHCISSLVCYLMSLMWSFSPLVPFTVYVSLAAQNISDRQGFNFMVKRWSSLLMFVNFFSHVPFLRFCFFFPFAQSFVGIVFPVVLRSSGIHPREMMWWERKRKHVSSYPNSVFQSVQMKVKAEEM